MQNHVISSILHIHAEEKINVFHGNPPCVCGDFYCKVINSNLMVVLDEQGSPKTVGSIVRGAQSVLNLMRYILVMDQPTNLFDG